MHTHVSVILHTLGCRVRVLSALLSTLDCGRVSHQPAVSVWPGAQRRFGPVLFAVWDGLLAHHLSARPPSHTSHYVLSRSLSWEQAAGRKLSERREGFAKRLVPNALSHGQPSPGGQTFPGSAGMVAVVSLDQPQHLPEGPSLTSWLSATTNSSLRTGDTLV